MSIFVAVIGLLVAALIIFLIRKDKLHVRHGMGWVGVAVIFAFLGLSPGLFDWIAGHLGIAYPPIFAAIMGIAALVLKILFMDIEASRLETHNQRLIQRVAMLEADLRKLVSEKSE